MTHASKEPFDRDLGRILDRVYGLAPNGGVEKEVTRFERTLERDRHRRDAELLDQALERLRFLREQSQGISAMREEIDYLHKEILRLRGLGEQISLLRMQLAQEAPGKAVRAETQGKV